MKRIAEIEKNKISSMPQGPGRLRLLGFGRRFPNVFRRWFWLIWATFYFSAAFSAAPAAEVADLIINHSRGHLLLPLKIRGVLTAEAGEPATGKSSSTVVLSIALYQVNNIWFDKELTHQTATNTLKYDPSKKEYSLMRSWDSGPPLFIGDLNQAGYLMTEIKGLKLMPLDGLEKGRNYQIRVRAIWQDENAIVFSPAGCFKTDWYTVDFTF